MFLSNQQAAAQAILLVIIVAAGCSWFGGNDPPSNSSVTVKPPETGIPFETREPATFQADFITVSGGGESRSVRLGEQCIGLRIHLGDQLSSQFQGVLFCVTTCCLVESTQVRKETEIAHLKQAGQRDTVLPAPAEGKAKRR